jgi:hypothetical protein
MKNEVTLKIHTEQDMKYHQKNLKDYGYNKTHDCMWVQIYEKGNSVVTLCREF